METTPPKRGKKPGPEDEGQVLKVLFFDEKGESTGEWKSQQIPEDPFAGMKGIIEPPFSMEQLVFLAEMHPVHSAALEQKTTDIIGQGFEWTAEDPETAQDEDRKALDDWFHELAPEDADIKETAYSIWLDVETVGWGLAEVVRDPKGAVKKLYHVPGHTVRAHKDGFRLVQIRDQRKAWFRRWGSPDVNNQKVNVDSKTGSTTKVNDEANDLIVIKKPSRRSSWYGIPGYVSAIGWITLSLACRDDNLLFFSNRREPRWAVIMYNIAETPNLEEDLRRAFTVDLKQPHRNLLIPIAGQGKIDFHQLSGKTVSEGSFDKLSERADRAIMIAHRVPGERLANSQIGPLGGNATQAASKVYKEAVVTPSQAILNSRFNRFIDVEYELATKSKPEWKVSVDELDIQSDREDLDLAVIAFHADLITLREARNRLKLDPLMKPATPTVAPPGEGAQVIDPVTGLPSGSATPELPGATPDAQFDSDGEPISEEEVESEYNDMLYTELPGVKASPMAPPGTGGLGPTNVAGARVTDVEDGLRVLYEAAVAQHSAIEDLIEQEARED